MWNFPHGSRRALSILTHISRELSADAGFAVLIPRVSFVFEGSFVVVADMQSHNRIDGWNFSQRCSILPVQRALCGSMRDFGFTSSLSFLKPIYIAALAIGEMWKENGRMEKALFECRKEEADQIGQKKRRFLSLVRVDVPG